MNQMLRAAFSAINECLKEDQRTVFFMASAGVVPFDEIEDARSIAPERALDIGIMEAEAVSMGAGLSIAGMIPIFFAQAPFLTERAYEQLKVDFGYQNVRGNFLSISGSTELAVFGATHCCPADVPILKQIPNMQIIVPGSSGEFLQLFQEGYDNEAPTYFRLTRYENSLAQRVRIGHANVVKKGTKATILAVGYMVELAMECFAEEDVTILSYTTVMPFDGEILRENYTNQRILLMEPYYSGQLAPEIADALQGEFIKMEFVGIPHEFVTNYGYVAQNLEHFGFTKEQVLEKYKRLLL